ncbi:SGNH/GDSL hydrolase family protein [Tsukamurella sp. 1534]|uniref:SGNH/GDSL hydrolase family protein n=1 Tax=Tsukamurella sp. 1534 TaxID=1151061 RepID=UPI000309BDC5|nr:SGNH/GDSL hydrolase family protein [Tsukamurella sp. 1534]
MRAARLPRLLAQAAHVARHTPRLPEAGGCSGTAGDGAPTTRIVALGDSVAAGVGVEHHRDTITGRLAAALAGDGAATWEVRARSGATAGHVPAQAAGLGDPDVVLISLGVNDVKNLHRAARWERELAAALDGVLAAAPRARVLLLGLPPLTTFPALPPELGAALDARARGFDDAARQLAGDRPRVTHVPCAFPDEAGMFAADGFHPSAAAHAAFADLCAAAVQDGADSTRRGHRS